MKFEILPVEVSDLVPFSSSQNSYDSETTFAGVSKNGLWMWLVCDTSINIYHTENSEWFGGYCFGKSLKNPSAKITAVTEFCSSHISFPCLLIAVSHDHESLICMYDVNISKVVRAVLVPDTVLSLEVISGNGGACIDTLHLFMQLRYMFGVVAVGTSAGHLYFLDLCLDEDFTCDENNPNITFVLKKYELLPERRESVISKQQHIFMLLNDQSVRNGSFEFESRSSSLGHFPYGKVHVTALKYIQSTVTLAMGFNFGGIQLWNLQDLCLLYTVANQLQELPIIAFAFQEPENDPRHFCYLWIIRGHSASERPEDFSVATMYSLVYEKRTYVESFGYLYTELRNCFKRFEYRMTSDPFSAAQSSSAAGSCLLSCQTVCQTDESHCLDVCSANDSDTVPENMSLCFLSWIVWSHSENSPSSYHLALFDLNQWYRAEMPSSNIRSDPADLNPYFAHFSLEGVAQIFDLEPLLGLYTVPHSIKKFKYISPSEEFFYPSSLDFQTMVFSTNGVCRTTFMGLQKRLLYDIADMGPSVLINPKDFYSNLMRCGLVSDALTATDRVPLIVQRETLMQLALEYHMPFFFMKCLKEWRYADSIQEGCTSRALLNWAWKKVTQIKSSIDKLIIPLFNCSGSDVDKAPLKCLYSYRRQLDLVDTIFMGYQKFVTPRTEQGIQELKCRKDVVFSINMYLQVILWLRSVHVLPEVCEGEETQKNVLYPVTTLLKSYSKRRGQLQKIHSSIGPTDILLIDGLVKEIFNENTWQEKGGNGNYPPPSIYAALSCYLLNDVNLELKHCLMYYVLLDMCNSPHNAKGPLVSEVKKFPGVFGMSPSVSKLVKAFWFLDQFKFETAIKKLLHPAVKASDVLPWQHHRVIKSFLYQTEAKKALKYIHHMEPPENTIEDMKLHLSVLLARGAIDQAFDYQRNKQSLAFGAELLNHLFLGCQEMHKLKDLMDRPLNTLESSTLVKFLSENKDPRAQEALVMYYLLRCNFFEAAKINNKLSMSLMGKSTSTLDRTAGRDALVEGLLSSVPKTEKNLVDEINRFPSVPIKKAETLKPLSLSIKSIPMKQITCSDIMNSLISEASSAMCAPYLDPHTPFKSTTRSCYENLPFLRPPLTPERTKISSENIHCTPVTKRTLTSPCSEFSSPSKKSRLLDNAPFKTPLSNKKIPKHLAGDVASLLQSPPIHRRNSSQGRNVSVNDSSATAPQGILKKKVEPNRFSTFETYNSKTPSVLSDAGEDSDSEDDDKMFVDDAPDDDAPARQIRFSVPPKEDLIVSNTYTESPVIHTSYDHSSFMKRLEILKSKPASEQVASDSKDFVNVTQRKTLLGLTREPLKHFSKVPPKEIFPPSKSNKLACEKPFIETGNASTPNTLQHKAVKPPVFSIDISDSDSCPALEDKPKNDEYKVASFQSSTRMFSSSSQFGIKTTELGLQDSAYKSHVESPLNKSGSSSGNSSYNSASERSFIITSRRPLRDNSINTSFSSNSMLSAQENVRDETLLGNEMIIDDDNNDSNNNCEGDEDISIIGEVSAPSFGRHFESSERGNEEDCHIERFITNFQHIEKENPVEERHTDEKSSEKGIQEHPKGEKSSEIDNEEYHTEEKIREKGIEEDCHIKCYIEKVQHIEKEQSVKEHPTEEECFIEVHHTEVKNLNPCEFEEEHLVEHHIEQEHFTEVRHMEWKQLNPYELVGKEHLIERHVEEGMLFQHHHVDEHFTERHHVEEEHLIDHHHHIEEQYPLEERIEKKQHVVQHDIGEDYNISEDSLNSQTTASQPVEKIDYENENLESEVQNCDLSSNAFLSNKAFFNTEQVLDSHSQNKFPEQFSDSQNQCIDFIAEPLFELAHSSVQTSEEIKDDTNKNIFLEKKKDESGIEPVFELAHSSVQTSEEMKDDTNKNLFLEKKEDELDTGITNETLVHCTENKVNKSEDVGSGTSKFDNDVPATNLPEYVPIKERISRSHQSVSGLSKFDDDDDDDTYPSLLLQEQQELKRYEEVFESEKLGTQVHSVNLQSSLKPTEKLESIKECSLVTETDLQVAESFSDFKNISIPVFSSTKNFSEKLTERFDFLSKNSDFYENNKLYRETLKVLKESDIPQHFELYSEKKCSRKTRTFVFNKGEGTETETRATKSGDLNSERREGKEKEFLESWHPETYEQFSDSIQKGRTEDGQKETLKSSPNIAFGQSSVSIFNAGGESGTPKSEVKGRRKQVSVDKKQRSTIRKAKEKGKTPKKMEFSFAEPHSPAGPEILEALTTPSEYPVGSFMFSPPLTRGRSRQKRLDESLGSSFASVASETSFAKAKKPPVDPILEEIMAEKAPESRKLIASTSKSTTKSSAKKKTLPRKTTKIDVPRFDISDASLNVSSLVDIGSPDLSTNKDSSSTKHVTKHKMVLRHPKTKPRTEQLF